MTSQHVKREPSEESGHLSPVDSEQDSDDISSVSSRGTDQFARPKPKVRRTNSNNAAGAAMRARKYNSDPAVMSKRYRWHNQLQTLTSALSSRSTRVRNRLDSNVTYDEVVHIAAAEIEKLRLEVAALEAKLSAKQALQSLRQHRIPSRPSASPSPAVSPASASSSGITGMSVDSSASPIPSEEDIKPGSVSFWDTLVLSEAACALVSPSLRVLQCTESFARSRFQPMSKAALLQSNMSILDFFPPSQTPEVLLMISSLWTFGSVSVDNFVIRNSTSPSDSVRLIDFTCFANKDPSKENRVNSIVFIIRKQHLAPPQASSSTPLMVPATTTSAFLRQQPQSTSSAVSASSSPAIYQNTSAATPSSTTPAYSSLALSSNLSDKSSNCASVPSVASTPATSVASAPLSLPLPAYKLPQSVPSLIDLVNSLSQSSQPKLTQFSASITSAVPQPVVAGSSLGPMMYPPFLSTSVSAYAAAAAAVTGSDTMSLYQQMKNANDSLRGRVLC